MIKLLIKFLMAITIPIWVIPAVFWLVADMAYEDLRKKFK